METSCFLSVVVGLSLWACTQASDAAVTGLPSACPHLFFYLSRLLHTTIMCARMHVCVRMRAPFVLKAIRSWNHCQSWTPEGDGRNLRLLALLTPLWFEWRRQLQPVMWLSHHQRETAHTHTHTHAYTELSDSLVHSWAGYLIWLNNHVIFMYKLVFVSCRSRTLTACGTLEVQEKPVSFAIQGCYHVVL